VIGVLFQGSVFSNNVVNYDVNSLKSHELIFEKIEKNEKTTYWPRDPPRASGQGIPPGKPPEQDCYHQEIPLRASGQGIAFLFVGSPM